MSVLILENDPFTQTSVEVWDRARVGTDQKNIRRPSMGLTLKAPRVASIALFRAQSSSQGERHVPISLRNSSAPDGHSSYIHNFVIQAVQYQRMEKSQVVETFGVPYVFFYGAKAEVVSVSGILINSPDFDWKNEWLDNYDRYLRGTKCVENRTRVFLGWDDMLAEGYILGTGLSWDANSPVMCPFNFTMLLAKPPVNVNLGGRKNNQKVTKGEEAPVLGTEMSRQLDPDLRPEYLLHGEYDSNVDPYVYIDSSTGLLYIDGALQEDDVDLLARINAEVLQDAATELAATTARDAARAASAGANTARVPDQDAPQESIAAADLLTCSFSTSPAGYDDRDLYGQSDLPDEFLYGESPAYSSPAGED